jgi:prepilin-type N-terminal cleavage/methylation domain-containing protein
VNRFRRLHDRGFTLVETVIVVALMGIVMSVLAATFVVVVRTNPANEARDDGARGLLGLSTWLPEDVSSTPPGTSADNGFHIDE